MYKYFKPFQATMKNVRMLKISAFRRKMICSVIQTVISPASAFAVCLFPATQPSLLRWAAVCVTIPSIKPSNAN